MHCHCTRSHKRLLAQRSTPSRKLPCSRYGRSLLYSTSSTAGASQGAAQREVDGARAYCINLIQKYDSPSYTLHTFIPPSALDAYFAIRAFNIELSLIPDTVSNPTIGAMRMQFWRDAIRSSFAGTPRKEPIVILLAHALSDLADRTGRRTTLSQHWFQRVISAREKQLHNSPYPTLESLESYAENTYSTLLYLTLSALPLTSLTTDHLASHIGKAAGITAVLRGLPLIAFPAPPPHHSNTSGLGGSLPSSSRQGAVTLPLDVMATAGVQEEAVLREAGTAPGLRDAVFTVATRANDHLITAREMLRNVRAGQDIDHAFEHAGDEGHQYHEDDHHGEGSASARPESNSPKAEVDRGFGVLMPVVSTSLWLQRLQKVDFDVFDPRLRKREWRLPWSAYWAFRRKTI
ncbi:MAG: hypothetical protein M1819_000366 [Sarea resinae]|nr:MAG: hypothetical protein M1819_000366 [Sarea resinae]